MDFQGLTELFHYEQLPSFLVQMVFAIGIGLVIGHQRHTVGKIMGKRSTIILILGSFLFTYASLRVGTDHGRVVAQIVTGVGFIGAGIIFKRGDKEIINLTTAILVWTVAALGVVVGLGLIIEAVVATAVLYYILRTVESRREINGKEEESDYVQDR